MANEQAQSKYVTVLLVAETCCACGIAFGMSEGMQRRRLDDQKLFYCPAGHGQHYTGETEAARFKRYYEDESARANTLRDERDRKERQLSAARGRITKIKNRVGRGVCPCCNRTFENVGRHMKGQHPGFIGQDVGA